MGQIKVLDRHLSRGTKKTTIGISQDCQPGAPNWKQEANNCTTIIGNFHFLHIQVSYDYVVLLPRV
jgi:hypothetical protein